MHIDENHPQARNKNPPQVQNKNHPQTRNKNCLSPENLRKQQNFRLRSLGHKTDKFNNKNNLIVTILTPIFAP